MTSYARLSTGNLVLLGIIVIVLVLAALAFCAIGKRIKRLFRKKTERTHARFVYKSVYLPFCIA